ncbi:hypothetical protein DesfrDRAFT_0970 [Solidesulfovibrio fructosivorans JJ]]|uniref:Uncharacterized protein n=1 Tax=Solidesulfovibrio fructosivorans JJ] TaxID=596151 RepID=E1JTM1_SOLFR|nr:hypothetical protein [Solidesulfovibrio fructosivorans]EFL52150.1 hypothetical protein DesfrDRAFT_0970 [Solidesulfovibrio fructosivorans JJ]]
MELRLAFTEFLFAFCAVVLADRVYGFSDRLLGRFAHKTDKPQLRAASANDWYVYFHRSDLTGEKEPARPAAPAARVIPAAARQPRRDSRPRLRA